MGTAGWTDKSLIESGWYPPDATTPEERLRYYARQFPMVEVDSTYYALPAEQTAAAWAQRSPEGFTFNVKAFSLFTDRELPYLHGHSQQWEAKSVQQRFRYRYDDEELATWAGNVQRLAQDADETHVVFNNCYRDYAHVNARQLAEILTSSTHRAAEHGGAVAGLAST